MFDIDHVHTRMGTGGEGHGESVRAAGWSGIGGNPILRLKMLE